METETEVQRNTKDVLSLLAEVGGKMRNDEDVKFIGREFVLPEKLTLKTAAEELTKRANDEEEYTNYSRTMNYRPWDGARATAQALKKCFGMFHQKNSLFNTSQMIDLKIGPNEMEQVPWGEFTVPGLDGVTFSTGSSNHPEFGKVFYISAYSQRKYRFEVMGVFTAIEEELRVNSLYRGKCFDGQEMPEFLDLSKFDPKKVVYSEDVFTQFEANVWSLLKYTDRLRGLGVGLKRAVLFEGPYGTGKTMGAYLTAQIAVANGWTFVYVRPGRDNYQEALTTARLYSPAVVFVEDVDTIAGSNVGSDEVSKILDLFDGISAKDTEILLITTTNHVEKLHKGMLRPGRLDAVIHVGALDLEGIEKLTKVLVPENRIADVDWSRVGLAMDGFLPAFIKEAVDRAIRYSLSRNHGEMRKLTTEDFVEAAVGLRPQLDLMDEASDERKVDGLQAAFEDTIVRGLEKSIIHNAATGMMINGRILTQVAEDIKTTVQSNITEAINETEVVSKKTDESSAYLQVQ